MSESKRRKHIEVCRPCPWCNCKVHACFDDVDVDRCEAECVRCKHCDKLVTIKIKVTACVTGLCC